MDNLTINGVAKNLKDSPYIIVSNNVHYVFSSKLHLNKFIEKREAFCEQVNDSLSRRFKINIVNNLLGEMVLYKKIENRGFLIRTFDPIKNEVINLCERDVVLDGVRKIRKNYREQ